MKRFLMIIALCVISLAGVFAQEESNIKVLGVASVNATPENVVVYIPVSVEKATYAECYTELVDKLSKLQESFRKIGVEEKELKISGFSIRENYKYVEKEDESKVIGYYGSASFTIEDSYDKDLLQEIINVVSQNEVSYNVSFKLSEEQKEKLRVEAIEKAVKDAKDKALILAKSSGVVLGNIITIKYGVGTEEIYSDDRLSGAVFGYASSPRRVASVDLSPQEITIKKKVIIVWAIDM